MSEHPMGDTPPAEPIGDDDVRYVEIDRGDVRWRFDREFLTSNWRCLFGDGCKGILSQPAEELNQGCCSLGAHFGDGPAGQEEARQISAYAALLTPGQWQYHDLGNSTLDVEEVDDGDEPDADADADTHANDSDRDATTSDRLGDRGFELLGDRGSLPDTDPRNGETIRGIYGDRRRTRTRVVDGGCVFLNRPGFAGGEGCALHIAAIEAGESPTEWKPSVCWQLPLRVDWALVDEADPDGPETATVRRWSRADWGEHGETMAWCCTERTEGAEAYSGDRVVVDSLADELTAIADTEVYVELTRRLRSR